MSPLININDIRVASPCPMPWDAMAGNQHVRHCGECKLNVYNLSAMTEIEIQRLLAMQRTEQRVCVRFYRRADGTMLAQDCPRGIKQLAKRVSKLGAAVFSALVSMNCAMARATTAGTTTAGSKTQPQACHRVQAQEQSANILLVVTDPDGAVVPGARIVLVDSAGKTKFKGKTDGAGALMKSDLPPGVYALKVSVQGFKEYSDVLHLPGSKSLKVNLKLSLASASTTIEVTTDTLGVVDVGMLATVSDSDRHAAPMAAPVRYQPMRQLLLFLPDERSAAGVNQDRQL
jgi:hypothetical protein